MTLTKAELADLLFEQLGLNKREAKDMVERFFEEVRIALESGDSVKLSGFGNFQLRLELGEPRNVQAHADKREADGAGLAYANLATKLWDIENLNSKQVATTDDVIARERGARSSREGADTIVSLLRSLDGLRAAG